LAYKPISHQLLRKDVVKLVESWMEAGEDFMFDFAANYEKVLRKDHGNMSFREFLTAQKNPQTWAEHLFVKATSCLLGIFHSCDK
jgi:hypothetical protein